MKSIITVGLNPTLQKTFVFSSLTADAVNRSKECHFDVAGKALNVSRVLSQLGKENIHLTQLGGSLRPVYLDLCAKDGLDVRWAESRSANESATANANAIRICCTLIDKEKNQVTELVEEGAGAGQGTEERILEVFDSLLPNGSMLVVSGSKTGGFSDNIIPEMVRRAKTLGLYVILDIRGADLVNSLPFRPDLIKPNLDEFTATFAGGEQGIVSGDKEKIAAQCRRIWTQYGCSIVLTRGGSSLWYAEAGNLEELAIESVQALNPIGSGDAFTAGLASALSDGAAFGEALAEAVRCGRLNALCLKPGSLR